MVRTAASAVDEKGRRVVSTPRAPQWARPLATAVRPTGLTRATSSGRVRRRTCTRAERQPRGRGGRRPVAPPLR
eukprot:4756387-Alexandrium_andersonii.AAC.1